MLTFEQTQAVYNLLDYFEFKLLKSLYPSLKVSQRAKEYEKVTPYKPKYLQDPPSNAKFQKTYTYANSMEDNKAILKILKLAHNMIDTHNYAYVTYNEQPPILEVGKVDNNKQKYDIQIKEDKTGRVVGKIQTSELR